MSPLLSLPLATCTEESGEDHPELAPYRSLDVSRLKIVGEGKWPMEKYISGPLWLPFQEPSFLWHGLDVGEADVPNLLAEDRHECLRLAQLWDARGILHLAEKPRKPGLFSRVFNAFKSSTVDRQIGDRRLPNIHELRIDGPSKFLPQGQQLTMLRVKRFTHGLRGSMTDRRDFYHQAEITEERAETNMLPFSYPGDELKGLCAFEAFRLRCEKGVSRKRESVGDQLGKTNVAHKPKADHARELFPCFKSLFQGDHLGVEFALQSHSGLLCENGLLKDECRILGNHCFPLGSKWEALVIDDYFVIGSEPLNTPSLSSFAATCLAEARRIYAFML